MSGKLPASVDATGTGYASPNFYSVEKHFWSGKPKNVNQDAHLSPEEQAANDKARTESLKAQGDRITEKLLAREEKIRQEEAMKKQIEAEKREKRMEKLKGMFGMKAKQKEDAKGKGKELGEDE